MSGAQTPGLVRCRAFGCLCHGEHVESCKRERPPRSVNCRGPGQTLEVSDMAQDTCSVDGCEFEVLYRKWGLCSRHLRRLRRHGDLNKGGPFRVRQADQCTVDGCSAVPKSRSLCTKHYTRWHRYGDPNREPSIASPGDPMAFAQRALASSTDDCIIWPYGTNTGYGSMRVDGVSTQVHRWVLTQSTSDDADLSALDAAHAPGVCHNRACINPRHLRWATRAENLADKTIDETDNRGERCGSAKLTEDDVHAIRQASGSHRAIGERFGVAPSTVADIIKGRTWSHLPLRT